MTARARQVAAGLAVGSALSLLADSLRLQGAVSYWGPRAPLMVGVAALVAWLWTTRARPLPAVATAALGLLWLAVAFTPLTSLLAEGLVRRDPPATADAIVVLSSRIQKDGELSATAMSRLLHGLELLAQGRAPRLVVTEAPPPSPSHAAPARALMEALRLEGELLAVGPVYDTREEARAVRGLFAERGFRSLVLVTSPTHSRRACLTFEKQGLVVASSPAVETDFDLETFETADDRLRAFGPVLHERLGLLLYRWRGDL